MDERADKRVAACVEMLQRSMTVRSICTALRMSPVTVQAIKKSANPVEYRIKKAGRRPSSRVAGFQAYTSWLLTLIQWKWWTQISSKSAPGRLS